MHLKDSLSGEFRQVSPRNISIYACGITPYSASHVGHARTYVIFDALAKVLRKMGHEVTLVRNITDIDDKIIKQAEKEGIQWHELSSKWAAVNRQLMLDTGLEVPVEPKASEYLPSMFWMIEQLLLKNLAYVALNGDVNFRAQEWSGAKLMHHEDGALLSDQGSSRVDIQSKESSHDFALWKRMPDTQVGFESPWGHGRPGWHIECSAMIAKLFGGSVTIHGGGVDLKFPHHQAEIMQSEGVFERPLADIWMHNGSVEISRKKMGKSMGNTLGWRFILDEAETIAGEAFSGALLRATMLQSHWGKPLNWRSNLLQSTFSMMQSLTQVLGDTEMRIVDDRVHQEVLSRLSDNFNTPAFFTWLQEQKKKGQIQKLSAGLQVLGLPAVHWKSPVAKVDAAAAQLQQDHLQARLQKNWPVADALRKQLSDAGIEPLSVKIA